MRTPAQRRLNRVQREEAYDEVLLESAGYPIALSVWKGEPGIPAVVFLPGTMTHPLFYEDFLDALNRAGHTVVGLHAAGHGKSPRLPRRLTFGALLTNVQDAVAWTRAGFEDAPVVLMGSSQGGALALAAASRTDQVAAVFAHNVLDAGLPATLEVTRAPAWLAPAYAGLLRGMRIVAAVAPGVPVPFDAYLDIHRVTGDPEIAEQFYTDPLGRRTYPLGLLAGMLEEDVTRPVACPVVVVAGSGDPLFSLAYTRQVFERINAPRKELLVIDSDRHLLFNEALDVVLPVLLPELATFRADTPADAPAAARRRVATR